MACGDDTGAREAGVPVPCGKCCLDNLSPETRGQLIFHVVVVASLTTAFVVIAVTCAACLLVLS